MPLIVQARGVGGEVVLAFGCACCDSGVVVVVVVLFEQASNHLPVRKQTNEAFVYTQLFAHHLLCSALLCSTLLLPFSFWLPSITTNLPTLNVRPWATPGPTPSLR